MKPGKVKIKNFRKKLKELSDSELKLRADMKHLYDQFTLDVRDDEVALRHVRLAFYEIQKYRIRALLEERMEFHPFFGANIRSSHYFAQFDDEEDHEGFEDEGDDDHLM